MEQLALFLVLVALLVRQVQAEPLVPLVAQELLAQAEQLDQVEPLAPLEPLVQLGLRA